MGQGHPRHGRQAGLIVDAPVCASLDEVRKRIDDLDEEIVRILARRFALARQAAGFKASAAEVPAPDRVIQVLSHVREAANRYSAPAAAVEGIYRTVIEATIALELELKKRPQDS